MKSKRSTAGDTRSPKGRVKSELRLVNRNLLGRKRFVFGYLSLLGSPARRVVWPSDQRRFVDLPAQRNRGAVEFACSASAERY